MAEKKVPSFEENLEKLESIVKKLETGEVPLDEAIDYAYIYCQKFSTYAIVYDKKNAEEAITKLVKDNGDVVDFKVEE